MLRNRRIDVVRDHIEHRPGRLHQIFAFQFAWRGHTSKNPAFTRRTRSEKQTAWCGILEESSKCRDVSAVGRGVVTLRSAAIACEVRFIYELRGIDAAAGGLRIGKESPSLFGSPVALGIACSGAECKGSHDLGIGGARKIDDALPLLSADDPVKPRGRFLGRRSVRIMEVDRVRPGAADAHIRRPQRSRQLLKASVGQVDGGTVLVEVSGHCRRRRAGLPGGRGHFLPCTIVRFPEPPARDLDHFDVVGLKP